MPVTDHEFHLAFVMVALMEEGVVLIIRSDRSYGRPRECYTTR